MASDNLFENPRAVLALLHCAVSQAGGRVLIKPTVDQLALMSADEDPEVGCLRYMITEEGVLLETENFKPS